jgi:enoyl-CoA hydratase/carnithine racemase
MPFEEIRYEATNHIATVTLHRPERLNAWTSRMEKEVREAMAQAERDDDVRVIVLTGAGRGFCAGMDIQALGELASGGTVTPAVLERIRAEFLTPAPREGARPDFQRTYSYFPAIGKPIIAAINGPCIGLGLVMALYCDLRFASDTAQFSTAFASRGLIAEHGLSWVLPRLVGVANACDLLFSARKVDAAEAGRMGLVNRVIPADHLPQQVEAYASMLATQVSPRSLCVMKKQIYAGLFQTLNEAIDQANEEMFASLACADFREGIAHFMEKRAPKFTGR